MLDGLAQQPRGGNHIVGKEIMTSCVRGWTKELRNGCCLGSERALSNVQSVKMMTHMCVLEGQTYGKQREGTKTRRKKGGQNRIYIEEGLLRTY